MNIRTVACIGAGLIGQNWTTLFSSKGLEVTLHDVTQDILQNSITNIVSSLIFLEENNLLRAGEADAALKRIRPTTELDAQAPHHTILASSASGLLMTEIQKVTTRPERCVLAHPVLPAHLIPLVEIVGGEHTSPSTVKATRDFMKSIGKTPVVLNREVPGYIVNRLQAALLREAIDLVHKGIASASDVDTAFCMGIGLRDPLIGPFLRIHLAGSGVERFIENFSRSYQYRWETMETWTSIPPSAAKSIIKGVNEMEVVRTKTLDDIKSWRDEMLIKILKLLGEE
jgi:3-hydroxypropionate dehydrogenase (NADP+)